jgi:hypothetical protein
MSAALFLLCLCLAYSATALIPGIPGILRNRISGLCISKTRPSFTRATRVYEIAPENSPDETPEKILEQAKESAQQAKQSAQQAKETAQDFFKDLQVKEMAMKAKDQAVEFFKDLSEEGAGGAGAGAGVKIFKVHSITAAVFGSLLVLAPGIISGGNGFLENAYSAWGVFILAVAYLTYKAPKQSPDVQVLFQALYVIYDCMSI